MKISASDGRSYEVRPADTGRGGESGEDVYEVRLGGDRVGTFEVTADDIRPKPEAGRTEPKLLLEIAQEFLERGGGTMRMA